MRRMWLALLCASVLALTACAGLPTSGPVQPGPGATTEATDPDVSYRPDAPQPGATPQQIVEGFVRAASGPQDNWQIARLFLSAGYRETWNPEAGVLVDVLADREYAEPSEGSVSLQITPAATVDEAGTYTRSDGGASAPLSYTLAQQGNGEWRITRAPDGILMDEDLFNTGNVFRSYALMYFDPTWDFLVPDVRWFPRANAVTRIASALVNGEPSEWLADAVISSFPDNVTLVPSVPVPNGVAQAELSEQVLALDQVTLDRMQTQLSASLGTAQIGGVDMLVDGGRVGATKVATRDTNVDARALVLDADGFGFLLSNQITAIPGLSEAIVDAEPTAIQTAPDKTSAAVLLPDGSAGLVTADGTTVVDDRAGVIAPTIDPFDVIWTVPTDDPDAVRATLRNGTALALAANWGASSISAMQISRDGTRIAAIITLGGTPTVVVAGVIRDSDGVPTALGEAVALAPLSGTGLDVAWVDAATIGVLAGPADAVQYVQQPVGGDTVAWEAPAGAVSLAGVNLPSAVRVLDGNGALFVRRQSNWVQTGAGIDVLAVQQGAAP